MWIYITGIPVPLEPIEEYIRHLRQRHIKNLSMYEYERQRLHDNIFTSAGFKSGINEYDKARIVYRESDFGSSLEHLLTHAFACPKCKYSTDRDNKCMECKEFISVEDNIDTLYRIATKTRRD